MSAPVLVQIAGESVVFYSFVAAVYSALLRYDKMPTATTICHLFRTLHKEKDL